MATSPVPSGVVAIAPGTHYPALDGLRGIAILSVMAFHFLLFSGIEPRGRLERILFSGGEAGWFGVDLFFVLSGFLITGILFDTRNRPGSAKTFYWRRALRIFPLYYGFLAMRFFVLPRLTSASPAQRIPFESQLWQWSYLSNVQITLRGWEGLPYDLQHFWSLAIEEQFYLVWPWLVFSLSRRALLQICAGMMIGALVLRAVLVGRGFGIAGYVLTPARMDPLAVGAALALIWREPRDRAIAARWSRPVVVVAGLALALMFVLRKGLRAQDPVVGTFGFSLLAVFFGALLFIGLTASPTGRARRTLSAAPLRFFGKYSYALYVFHQPVVLRLAAAGLAALLIPKVGGGLPGAVCFAAVALAVSLVAALASWNLWEKYFLRLKNRLAVLPADGAVPPAGKPSSAAP
jgi:peptidoglycan/LPS O-acetylase OafA/YrhL